MNDISKAQQEFLDEIQQYPDAFQSKVDSSRRGFIRGTAAAGVALGAAGALGACATKTATHGTTAPVTGASGVTAVPEGKLGTDKSETEKVVNFSNWVSYIDVDPNDKTKRPTLANFKTQTGITVNYTEDVNSNDDFFAKVHQQLADGQDTGRDIMVLSDWMISKLRQLGYLELLDMSNIPNAKNLTAAAANPAYDPNRKHTVPWAQGFTLIGVNLKSAGLTADLAKQMSIKDMMTNPKYNGKVGYFAEMEDGTGFAMLALGFDPANFTDDQFNQAVAYVQKAKDNNQIRKFTGNDYLADLQNGNFAVCMAYSGDVAQLDDANIVWTVPTEGMLWFADNMCIPAMASHKANAEKFMNYMLDPKVAAALDDSISYVPSMVGADAAMKVLDAPQLGNLLIFPDDKTKAQAHEFKALDLKTIDAYIKKFNTVVNG